MNLSFLLQFSVIIGLFEAAPLILAALGFTLILKLNGFINVAFAENLMIGAYTALFFNVFLGMNFYVSIIPAVIVSGLVSAASYLCVFRPAMKRGVQGIELVIMSVGLSFFLRYALTMGLGVTVHSFANKVNFTKIFGIGVTDLQVICLAIAVVVSIVFLLFMFKTKYGEKMRALSDNEQLAKTSGINPLRVSVMIWFMAGVAGGFAGIFLGAFSFIVPWMGWDQILIIIMIAIVGGTGSVPGAIIVGLASSILRTGLTLQIETYTAAITLLILYVAALKIKSMRAGGIKV